MVTWPVRSLIVGFLSAEWNCSQRMSTGTMLAGVRAPAADSVVISKPHLTQGVLEGNLILEEVVNPSLIKNYDRHKYQCHHQHNLQRQRAG